MLENLRILYRAHGGTAAILRSYYFWIAVILTILAAFSERPMDWSSIAIGSLPSLTGFSIASFALVFAVANGDVIARLSPPDASGYSPLLRTVAIFAHAVVVQVFTLVIASIPYPARLTKELVRFFPDFFQHACVQSLLLYSDAARNSVGAFLVIYSLMLVLALGLSAFRLVELVTKDNGPS